MGDDLEDGRMPDGSVQVSESLLGVFLSATFSRSTSCCSSTKCSHKMSPTNIGAFLQNSSFDSSHISLPFILKLDMKEVTVSLYNWNSWAAQSNQATTSITSQIRGSLGIPSCLVLSFQDA